MKFLGTLNTALNFVNPTANTTIQYAKATPGVYTLATLEDIPVAYLPPFDNDSYFPRGRDETQYGPIGTTFMILVMQKKGLLETRLVRSTRSSSY
jgi:hypothetical protein